MGGYLASRFGLKGVAPLSWHSALKEKTVTCGVS